MLRAVLTRHDTVPFGWGRNARRDVVAGGTYTVAFRATVQAYALLIFRSGPRYSTLSGLDLAGLLLFAPKLRRPNPQRRNRATAVR